LEKPRYARCNESDVTRREVLRVGSLSLLGISLGQYLQVSKALADNGLAGGPVKAQACILLWLEGGPSHMDTWDPKPNSAFKPISTNVDGIQISELFPRVARHMDKLAVIRSVRTEEDNHPQGTCYTLTGHRPGAALKFPSLGSIICKETGPRNELPQYVLVPQPCEHAFTSAFQDAFSANFIGGEYNPMVLPDPSQDDFRVADLTLPKSMSFEQIANRRTCLSVVDRFYREKENLAEFGLMDASSRQALAMLTSPGVKNAFDLSQETEKTKDAYGRDRVGQSVLLARRLVEGGCRFVTASGYRGAEWDTHGNNDKILRETLAPTLDRTLSVLLEDLKQRGLLETTLVVVMGEFGRTPDVNAAGGRDHYAKCWSLLLGGGGIRGGQVIGASDERAANVADRTVSIGDLFATIYKAFGIDYTKTYMSPVGRPVYIANSIGDEQGQPIQELV